MPPPVWRFILPRVVSATWAVWLAATSLAYIDGPPETLEKAAEILPIPVWLVWAIASGLCFLGSLVPPTDVPWLRNAGVFLRSSGLAISAGMLVVWGAEFMAGEMDRGWVSGKNYWLLAAGAMASGWYVGQGGHKPPRKGEDV